MFAELRVTSDTAVQREEPLHVGPLILDLKVVRGLTDETTKFEIGHGEIAIDIGLKLLKVAIVDSDDIILETGRKVGMKK